MKIVSVEQMRQIEAASVDRGVSLDQLQRNAAAAIASTMDRLFGTPEGPVLLLVGAGNNGRDALIAAALLKAWGWLPRIYLSPGVRSEDLLAPLSEGGVEVARDEDPGSREILVRWLDEAVLVVDGLLGIGIRGPSREPIAGIIRALNEQRRSPRVPVVAVDLPSGIDADSGEVPGEAVRATHTISLGCVKAGLLKFPAAEWVGELIPVAIGVPDDVLRSYPLYLVTPERVAASIPPRPLNGHKGTFGRVLLVSGSDNYVGASYLAGAAAARAGCGLVTLVVPMWQRGALVGLLPEATYLPLPELESVAAVDRAVGAVEGLLPNCSVLAIGPGLGQGEPQRQLVAGVLEANRRGPRLLAVVDADGLNALVGTDRWWERFGPGNVLTPHPGEMARLTGISTGEVNVDRWKTAGEAASRWGQVVVLKGAFTVVAAPDGRCWVNPRAQPALATAGTGDVLTGLIAGLVAQGAGAVDAAVAAVFIHSLAAELALKRIEGDRLLASDLLAAIPPAIHLVTSGEARSRTAPGV